MVGIRNKSQSMLEQDVIIVGGGLAGSRAAVEIARNNPSLSVAAVAKTHPIRSHSVAAQGGIAATLKNVDSADTREAHAFDTVKGSDYLADRDAVEILTREAPDVVIELEHMGVLFSRLPDGRIASPCLWRTQSQPPLLRRRQNRSRHPPRTR